MDQHAGQTRGPSNLSQEEVAYACPTCGLKVDRTVTVCPRDGSVIADYSSTENLLDNRYQVLSLVATGGMGSIYKARQPALNKIVAIKMLRVDSKNEAAWIRFQQEAKVFSHLEHRNIIKVYDFGEASNNQPYMVMDFVDGVDLAHLIKEEKTLPLEEAFNIIREICAGMGHAHAHRIFHRDLKPSNIMLSQLDSVNPQVRIVDFGIAKVLNNQSDGQNLTQTGEVFGSPHYMSPEQAMGKVVDASSDVYSLGCIMHETLTGAVPLAGATAFDTLMKHMNDKPPSLRQANPQGKFSDELVSLVLKTLAKDPLKRFQSMQELSSAIDLLPESIAIAKLKGPTSVYGAAASAVTIKNPTMKPAPPPQTESTGFIDSKNLVWLYVMLGVILAAGTVYVSFSAQNARNVAKVPFFNRLATPEATPETGPPPVVASEPPSPTEKKDPLSDEPPAPSDMSKITKGKADDGISLTPPGTEKEEPPPPPIVGSNLIDLTNIDSDLQVAESVRQNPQANTVILKGKYITDDGIKALTKLPIVRLVVQNTKLTEKGFAILAQFPDLEVLDLKQNSNLDDKSLIPIADMKKLKMLDLSQCPHISDETLSILPSSIDTLNLQGDFNLTEKGINDVCKLSNLKILDLSRTPLTDDEVKPLSKLTKLQTLFVGETCLTDRAMATMSKLPVKELALQKTRITKKGLMELADMPFVIHISVKNCPFVNGQDREDFRNHITKLIQLD